MLGDQRASCDEQNIFERSERRQLWRPSERARIERVVRHARDSIRFERAGRGWRVTFCPLIRPTSLVIPIVYGSEVARDIGLGGPVFVHSNTSDRARILGNCRCKVARDSAKALSTICCNSLFRSGDLQGEGGA